MESVSIIIVENSTELRNTLRNAFEKRGYIALNCRNPEMVVPLLETFHPHIMIVDLDIPDFEGDIFELMTVWHQISPHTRLIVESASADPERLRQAVIHGAEACLTKPYSLPPLFRLLESPVPGVPPQTQTA